jgi:pyridoxine/pyridoxamine 5'-phosphate oxidase
LVSPDFRIPASHRQVEADGNVRDVASEIVDYFKRPNGMRDEEWTRMQSDSDVDGEWYDLLDRSC